MVTEDEIAATQAAADFYADVDHVEQSLPRNEAPYLIRVLKEVIRRLECDIADQ